MNRSEATGSFRQTLLVLACVAFMLACVLFLQARSLASTKDTYDRAVSQLDGMRQDAAEIIRLREAPRTAAARSRTSQELLGQVEESVDTAGIARESWRDSIPQPTVRLSNSDYKRESTRLFLEQVGLRQVAAFVHSLQTADPTLKVSGINLVNRDPMREQFDVELAVSYLVYSPDQRATKRANP